MEAAGYFDMLMSIYQTTQHRTLEYYNLQTTNGRCT